MLNGDQYAKIVCYIYFSRFVVRGKVIFQSCISVHGGKAVPIHALETSPPPRPKSSLGPGLPLTLSKCRKVFLFSVCQVSIHNDACPKFVFADAFTHLMLSFCTFFWWVFQLRIKVHFTQPQKFPWASFTPSVSINVESTLQWWIQHSSHWNQWGRSKATPFWSNSKCFHWFYWELCRKSHHSIDSALTLTLGVNGRSGMNGQKLVMTTVRCSITWMSFRSYSLASWL